MSKKIAAMVCVVIALVMSTFAIAGATADTATVYVIHGINGVDLGQPMALPVDVSANGACVPALEGLTFEQVAGPLSLPAGTYDVAIYLHDAAMPCNPANLAIGPAALTLDGGQNYTIIAHLTETGTPTASLFTNDLSQTKFDQTRVVAHHTAEAPPVDITLKRKSPCENGKWEANKCEDDKAGLAAESEKDADHRHGSGRTVKIPNLSNGQSAAAEILAGKWQASVFLAGTDTKVLGPLDLDLKPTRVYSYYVVGSAENGLFVISQTFDTADATVYVIHGINGVDLGQPMALPVDVSANGACVPALEGLTFEQVAGPLSLPAGTYDVAIYLHDAAMPCNPANLAIGPAALTLDGGQNYTIIAHLTETGTPTASLFTNDLSQTKFYKTRVIAHHTAEAPPVDITLKRKSPRTVKIPNLSNGQSAAAEILAGKWKASVFLAGTDTRVLGPLDLVLRPTDVYSYYVVGSAENGLFVISQTFRRH